MTARRPVAGSLLLAALLVVGVARGDGPCPPDPSASGSGGIGPTGSLGIVFSGGGAKAAYEAGIALALAERQVVPGAVAGTSSGALSALMVAAGEAERLAALWRSVRREDVFEFRAATIFGGLLPGWLALPVLRTTRSLLDPAPLRETLARRIDLARVRTSPVQLLIVATDLLSGEPRRFDNRTVTVDALVASSTVPGLLPPVALDGGWLVDGGVVQRAPTLELLAAHPVDRLLVVLGYESDAPDEPTVQAVLERAFEIALAREIRRDVELARLRHPGTDVRLLRPSAPLRARPLEFDGSRLAGLVDLGRTDGLACLDALGHRGTGPRP